MATPSQEDYLETIWTLIRDKGYARVADVADRLGISTASASKMVQRLSRAGLVTYERYRGFHLTAEGLKKGQRLHQRHQLLVQLLGHLEIGTMEDIEQIVEGIEHHFSSVSLERVRALVNYIETHPNWWAAFLAACDEGTDASASAPAGRDADAPWDKEH
jgi:Mn-dependent DtxR family transcriptional regulator